MIYYQNFRSLNTKTHIRSNFPAADYKLIALTETWLDDDFNSSEIFDDTFVVHRSYRNREQTNKKTGGGCLVALKSDVSGIRITEWENELPIENVWIAIYLNNSNKKLYIHAPYIAPKITRYKYSIYFDHYINIICNTNPNSEFLILGDFNLNSISWLQTNSHCLPIWYDGNIATTECNRT